MDGVRVTPKRLSPYQRIMRAASRGAGLRLSPDDVFKLSMDSAIEIVATRDDGDGEECE